jgi:hypothetical protein
VGLRPTFADGPAASDDFRLVGLPGLPPVVSMGTTLLALIKLSEISKTKSSNDNLCFFPILK